MQVSPTVCPCLRGDCLTGCREKDGSTTQAALGFKICGMQVLTTVCSCLRDDCLTGCREKDGSTTHTALGFKICGMQVLTTVCPCLHDDCLTGCREKDGSTTQAALGFKICGMQVFRHGAGGYWRASKRWCKTLPVGLVDKALVSFAHNGELGWHWGKLVGVAAGAPASAGARRCRWGWWTRRWCRLHTTVSSAGWLAGWLVGRAGRAAGSWQRLFDWARICRCRAALMLLPRTQTRQLSTASPPSTHTCNPPHTPTRTPPHHTPHHTYPRTQAPPASCRRARPAAGRCVRRSCPLSSHPNPPTHPLTHQPQSQPPHLLAEHGLRPADVYGGPAGAIRQLEALESWFAMQREFHFYSSSGGC